MECKKHKEETKYPDYYLLFERSYTDLAFASSKTDKNVYNKIFYFNKHLNVKQTQTLQYCKLFSTAECIIFF
jgi:hypothetical protein